MNSTDPTPLPLSRLPVLFEKLYESLSVFFDAKLALFRKEVWEEGASLLARAIGIGTGVVLAFIGLLAMTAALILKLDTIFLNPALSCLVVGVAYLALGALVAIVMAKRSKKPLEKTRQELEKDKQWIKTQASGI